MTSRQDASTPVIEARNLVVRYGDSTVVDVSSLRIEPRRWTAIVGPNGAGKTSLLRAIAGHSPHEGDVDLMGQISSRWSPRAKAQIMSWLGQNETGAEDLRAWDVVMLGRIPHQSWFGGNSPADVAAVEKAMTQTQCLQWRSRPLGELSGGERQRVLLARALAVEAKVLLMDEPLANLDLPHQVDWMDIVRSQVADGAAVVSVLHEINVALRADVVAVMQAGKLLHQGEPSDRATRDALMTVFEQRMSIHEIDGRWVVIPK